MLQEWDRQVTKEHSFVALRRLLGAFRSACRASPGDLANEPKAADDDEERRAPPQRLPFRIESGAVFNRAIILALRHAPAMFDRLLGIDTRSDLTQSPSALTSSTSSTTTLSAGKNLPSAAPRWRPLSGWARSFVANATHFVSGLSEPRLVHHVLRALERSAAYVACFPKIHRRLLRATLSFWAGAAGLTSSSSSSASSSTDVVVGEEHARVVAFLLLRRMALLCPYPFIDDALKAAYATFVKNSRFTTAKTAPTVTFMMNGMVELYGLDAGTTYQHAFLSIRQMAIHLRNALVAKTKEAFRTIYNWQFMWCLRVWSATLAQHAVDAVHE